MISMQFCLRSFGIIVATVFFSELFFSYAHGEEKILSIDTGASCITVDCHAKMGKKKYVHPQSVKGDLCTGCHEITKEGMHLFKDIPTESTGLLCAKCHSEEFKTPPGLKGEPPKIIRADKDLQKHAPFAEGKCTVCHDAHESNFYKHLKKEYPENIYVYFATGAYDLCFNADCHGGLGEAFAIPRTMTNTKFRNGNLNLHFRHVNKVKGRSCSVCHDPHASLAPKLIRQSFHFGKRDLTINYEKTETGGTCSTTCHKVTQYDRYDPVSNPINVSPRPGKDASLEELQRSRERDMEENNTKKANEPPGESTVPEEGNDNQEGTGLIQ